MAQANKASNEQPEASKGPDYFVYQVREGERGKKFWVPLGAAFRHEDGKGISLELNAMPVGVFDGRLVLRAPREEQEKGA